MAVEIRAATYAALRTALAAGTYQTGQMVFVESIDGTNTNGAGIFQVKYDAGGGFVDDGGAMLTSADGTWAADRIRESGIYNAAWYGLSESGSAANNSFAIQAALDSARSNLIESVSSINDVGFSTKGGAVVCIPAGEFSINSVEVPETVALAGHGAQSTVLRSSYNGQVVRNKVSLGDGQYDKFGINLRGFSIVGDRSQSLQTCLDILRAHDSIVTDIAINQSGGDGAKFRQCLGGVVNIHATHCVGHGVVLDGGIDYWATGNPTNLPTNAMRFVSCLFHKNDGAGIKVTGRAGGNVFESCVAQANYDSSGANVGYQIEINAISTTENVFSDCWVEGDCRAHIYINSDSATDRTVINRLHHAGSGISGPVDRAVIVDSGVVVLNGCSGKTGNYKSINGSVKPFRVNVSGGVASVEVFNCSGSSISDGVHLEDENGSAVSFMPQVSQDMPISGLDFSSTISATGENVLDDYEEGTWTPTLVTDGVAFGSVTYNALNGGKYTKIGRLVVVQGTLRTDSVTKDSASGNVQIAGLPFLSGPNTGSTHDGYATAIVSQSGSWLANHPLGGYVASSANRIYLTTKTSVNGATSLVGVSDVATGANSNLLRFAVAYVT